MIQFSIEDYTCSLQVQTVQLTRLEKQHLLVASANGSLNETLETTPVRRKCQDSHLMHVETVCGHYPCSLQAKNTRRCGICLLHVSKDVTCHPCYYIVGQSHEKLVKVSCRIVCHVRANKQLLWNPMPSRGSVRGLVVSLLNVVYCNALYKMYKKLG